MRLFKLNHKIRHNWSSILTEELISHLKEIWDKIKLGETIKNDSDRFEVI